MFFPLLLFSAIAAGAPKSSGAMLIFEFPDGVRGGHGKILGAAKPFGSKELGFSFPEDTLAELSKCGLKDARWKDWATHRGFVVGKSTAENVRIVRCYQKRTYRNFNVGVGRSWPFEFDDSAFRKFWTRPKIQTRQVAN